MLKKNAPHIKWVISFADGCQCGDGTIYRASGFKLLEIRRNDAIRINPKTGEKVHTIQAHHLKIPASEWNTWQPVAGYMLKYVYFIDKSCIERLTVPILPYSKIDELNVGMYKGKQISQAERHKKAAPG